LLSSLDVPSRKEWFLRLWCAKEAVAKTTGRGLVREPGSLKIQDLDLRTGMVQVALSGELAKALPHLAERYIAAYTVRENDLVCASALV
jgi:phosphopantetheinyl transferase